MNRSGKPKERMALALVTKAQAIKVWTKDTVEDAGTLLNRVKAAREWWQGLCRPKIDKYKAQHTASLDMMRTLDEPLAKAEAHLKQGIGGYLTKLRQEQARQQAEQDEAARKQAEAERARTVKTLEQNGHAAEARQVARQPLIVPPVVASVERPKLAYIALTERWKFHILDPALLPREYLMPDEVKIGRVVRALRAETRIPGVEIFMEGGVSAGVGSES